MKSIRRRPFARGLFRSGLGLSVVSLVAFLVSWSSAAGIGRAEAAQIAALIYAGAIGGGVLTFVGLAMGGWRR